MKNSIQHTSKPQATITGGRTITDMLDDWHKQRAQPAGQAHPLPAIIVHTPANNENATIYRAVPIVQVTLPISPMRAANILADLFPAWWELPHVAPMMRHLFLDFSGQSQATSSLPCDQEWFIIPAPPAGHHDPDDADRVHLIDTGEAHHG